VNQDKTNLSDPGENQPAEEVGKNNEIEDFFQRLPGSFHWPKPDAESVAAAVEAVHRMSGGASAHEPAANGEEEGTQSNCSSCGGLLPGLARFCVWCGAPTRHLSGDASPQRRNEMEQHHVHHHYHHIVPGPGAAAAVAEAGTSAPRGRAQSAPGTPSGGRAEASARQIVQDWAQACNTKHVDDLLELYSADATLIRSSVQPVRSLPAIRAFLVSLLEAGLGDVEMESLRLEVMGDIALDLGRCKMLVPVAMGKRREERGKYLIVLVRQPAGNWKILADCWSSDLAVSGPLADATPRTASEANTPLRKPR
jgi:ketosteroid isomerase-like protein